MTNDSTSTSVLNRLVTAVSRPEHTGENRCLPCTIVNAVGVAVVAGLLSRRRRSLGLLAALIGGAAIWLRGYVVPGTPRFAPRIVDPLPIDIGPDHPDLESGSLAGNVDPTGAGDRADVAGTGDAAGTSDASDTSDVADVAAETTGSSDAPDVAAETTGSSDAPDADAGIALGSDPNESGREDGEDSAVAPEAVMQTLVDVDALVDDGERLVLDGSFRAAVYDRIESLRREPNEVLADRAAAIAGPDVEGDAHDGRILLAGGRDTWLSRSIALAETAFAETLRDRGVDDAVARAGARPLRAFLDTCPVCDGPVRETTLRNCCGGPGGVSGNPERPVRACADCDAVAFTDRP